MSCMACHCSGLKHYWSCFSCKQTASIFRILLHILSLKSRMKDFFRLSVQARRTWTGNETTEELKLAFVHRKHMNSVPCVPPSDIPPPPHTHTQTKLISTHHSAGPKTLHSHTYHFVSMLQGLLQRTNKFCVKLIHKLISWQSCVIKVTYYTGTFHSHLLVKKHKNYATGFNLSKQQLNARILLQQKTIQSNPFQSCVVPFPISWFSFFTLMFEHAWLLINLCTLQSSIDGGGPTR